MNNEHGHESVIKKSFKTILWIVITQGLQNQIIT